MRILIVKLGKVCTIVTVDTDLHNEGSQRGRRDSIEETI